MDNNEEKKTEDVTGPPDQFVGRDLLESYMYYRNYMPSNPYEAYGIKKKCIEFGKELLPSFIDPDETDEEQMKKNKVEQDNTDELYKKACVALKTEIANRREIKYDHLIKEHRVYILTSDDADTCEALKEELEIVKNDFINQQHEQHMEKLEVVDNEIFHILSITGIVPAINPTLSDMIKERLKERYRMREENVTIN